MSGTHTWNIPISPLTYYTWSPSTLNFPDSIIDATYPQCSVNKTVTITNLTTSLIHLMVDFAVGSPYIANAYKVSTDASNYFPTVNFDIAGSGSKTIYVVFCPQVAGSNSGLLMIHCQTPVACSGGAPGSVPLSGIGTQCVGEISAYYDWPDPVVELTTDQQIIFFTVKNKYAAGSPNYGAFGTVSWRAYYSSDGTTYVPYTSALGCTTNCFAFVALNPLATADEIIKATCPAYTVNPSHKWYLGLKVWGQSETEPANLSLIIGPDGAYVPGLISNTSLLLGAIGLAGLAGLLWYTKKKKMW